MLDFERFYLTFQEIKYRLIKITFLSNKNENLFDLIGMF